MKACPKNLDEIVPLSALVGRVLGRPGRPIENGSMLCQEHFPLDSSALYRWNDHMDAVDRRSTSDLGKDAIQAAGCKYIMHHGTGSTCLFGKHAAVQAAVG